ncbi:bifunctional phosphopantothenoylcysteine decarboxylase/phosphopantothenate--cysteine ligase CoaBC [Microlunatus elymi]|uniref:Coenzyme A biosynthesis bifunctional protein CoaBC n=1 Tax=Microlunatus elymi TaxID=2596828 RepID=A0A516PZZ8_9ACTN|nr:bifunctional phosphopantothenoylcysteine decarboxylase/phosphopantothenate--cysteine ligase CoaBC [Microlunatus elymi]QDP96756.1 bifunctional phosphopantothenoylcysteine decarboxylase/phosphopantothenate--cysteine ligase CoaBC [Microlunatus elymi]
MSRILLGVSGGIAAYKAAELLRRLKESGDQAEGHDVTVVPTEAALRFVGAPTWEALSGHPVSTDVFTEVDSVRHVSLGRRADLVIVAPATADLLARAAAGRADDLLTGCLLTATCPVIFAPAMHTEMWRHPATQHNVSTLRHRGAVVVDPASGRLTGADSGPGRLPEPEELATIARTVLAGPAIAAAAARRDLAGLRIVISAGGTHEPLDPVRFIGNASSGRMGWALARAAVLRGADVALVAANVTLPDPAGTEVRTATTTRELEEQVGKAADGADIVVMAAAPADFRPASEQPSKIKKSSSADADQGLELSLVQNPDILAGLVRARTDQRQVLVGFAAETADTPEQLISLGRDKLARKGCDLLVLNAVGHGRVFGRADSEIRIIGGSADESETPPALAGSKELLAHHILDAALQVRSER